MEPGQAILYGEFELTIDEKNRVLIPAEFRKTLEASGDATNFIVLVGSDRVPWVIPMQAYKRLVSKREEELEQTGDHLDFDDQYFAMARAVECDKAGRILLPEKVLKRTNTGREVTVTGNRWRMKIWNRADWEARAETLLTKSAAKDEI